MFQTVVNGILIGGPFHDVLFKYPMPVVIPGDDMDNGSCKMLNI